MTDKFSHFFQKLSEPKIYIMDCWKSKAYYTCWLCGRKNLKVIRFHGKATWFTERNSFFFIEAKKTYRTSVVFRTLKKLLSVFGLNCEFKDHFSELFFSQKKESEFSYKTQKMYIQASISFCSEIFLKIWIQRRP